MGAYAVNNKDLVTTYGIHVMPGSSDDLLQMPDPKKFYSYDWGDVNGVEIDPQEPQRFEARKVTLYFTIMAATEAMFWSNYLAFIAEINKTGVQKWYVEELQRFFFLKHEKPGDMSRKTRLRNPEQTIVAQFSCQFLEPDPSFAGTEPYQPPLPPPPVEPNEPPPPALTSFAWGYSSSPVYGTDYTALTFQFGGLKDDVAPSMNYTNAANYNYLYMRAPFDAPMYARWENTNFNYGKFPDQIFHAPVPVGGFVYYLSRVQVLLDRVQTSIKFMS